LRKGKKTVKIPAVPRIRAFAIHDFSRAIVFCMSQSSGRIKEGNNMIDIKRNTGGKYDRLLDHLHILEYIETNNRPLTPREHEMRCDYQKQADALKAQGYTYGRNR
jgi:hypothetical protein